MEKRKIFGASLLIQFILFVIQGALLGLYGETREGYRAMVGVSSVFVFGLPTVFYSLETGYRPFSRQKNTQRTKSGFFAKNTVLLYVFGLSATVFAVNAVGFLTDFALGITTSSVSGAGWGENAGNIVYVFVKSVLLAAILEETLFRGAMADAFSGYSPKRTVILSGLLFGLMHYDISAFPYAFAAGCCIMFFALGTGSLTFAAALHFGQNLVTFLYGLMTAGASPETAAFLSYAMTGVFFAVTLIGMIVYFRSEKNSEPESKSAYAGNQPVLCREIVVYIVISAVFSVVAFIAKRG